MPKFVSLNIYTPKTGLGPVACFFTMMLCCIGLFAHAQQQDFVLKGVVFKLGTNQRLSKVLVANQSNGAIVITDDLGIFQIKCAMGDSLLFRQKDYADQKVGVVTQSAIMVYLQTNINLSQVNIKGLSKKQELQQVMGEYNSQGIYANGKPSVASAILSPLNGLYDLFGSGPKQARRFQQYSANEMEQIAVDRRFTKALVQRITGLADSIKLQAFVLGYKPSYEDIKAWNDYDLINYIKRSYLDFEKNGDKPPESGLQKLVPVTEPKKPE